MKPVDKASLKLPPANLGIDIHIGVPDRYDDVRHAVQANELLGLLRRRGARHTDRGLESVAVLPVEGRQAPDTPVIIEGRRHVWRGQGHRSGGSHMLRKPVGEIALDEPDDLGPVELVLEVQFAGGPQLAGSKGSRKQGRQG